MNWDREIEVEGKEGEKAAVTIGDIQSILMADLTKDEVEEFAGELIKWVELQPQFNLWE